MRDTRERTFFWLGVFVLPVFWSWFTLRRGFGIRHRVAAFSWLLVTIGLIFCGRESLLERWSLVTVGYPLVIAWLTIGLAAWFCFRVGLFPLTILEVFFLFIVFAPTALHLMNPIYRAIGSPFEWAWLLPPVIFAVLHLCVDPTERLFRRLFGRSEDDET
jgi:hypothetical protein